MSLDLNKINFKNLVWHFNKKIKEECRVLNSFLKGSIKNILEKIFAGLPRTVRGRPISIKADPKGKSFTYVNGNSIFIRDINVSFLIFFSKLFKQNYRKKSVLDPWNSKLFYTNCFYISWVSICSSTYVKEFMIGVQ